MPYRNLKCVLCGMTSVFQADSSSFAIEVECPHCCEKSRIVGFSYYVAAGIIIILLSIGVTVWFSMAGLGTFTIAAVVGAAIGIRLLWKGFAARAVPRSEIFFTLEAPCAPQCTVVHLAWYNLF